MFTPEGDERDAGVKERHQGDSLGLLVVAALCAAAAVYGFWLEWSIAAP